MATRAPEVDLSGIRDPQRLATVVVGLLLAVVGLAGVATFLGFSVLDDGLVLGIFGVPLWLGLTAIVAGLLGFVLSFYGGASTTFNKLAAGLVLPAVFLLAVTDWGLATGGLLPLAVGVVSLLLAVLLVVVGLVLLVGHPLALVFPIVALLAVGDWALGITANSPGASVNPPTLGLLLVLAVGVGLVGFEGGRRLT